MNNTGSSEFLQRLNQSQQRYQLPAGARQILLVRHGSSTGTSVRTVKVGALTIADPELTEDGKEQASKLAFYLMKEPISTIFVTPLIRTQQTALPLATQIDIEPVVLDDLREVHLGDWEHNIYEHAAAGHPLVGRMYAEESWEVLPNAESNLAFATRVRRGIETAASATKAGDTAVVICHGGTIAEICRQATTSRAFAFMGPDNTSVSRLVVCADGTWKLRSYNELAHLR